MPNSLIDPVKNASTLGFIFIILGIIDLLSIMSEGFQNMLGLLVAVITIAVGFGLRKHKLWAVYAIGVSAVITLVEIISMSTQGLPVTVGIIELVLESVLFFWLYSARKSFT